MRGRRDGTAHAGVSGRISDSPKNALINLAKDWLVFPLCTSYGWRSIVAVAAAISLVGCVSRKPSPSPMTTTLPSPTSSVMVANSSSQIPGEPTARTITHCPLPTPGAKPACDLT
jgi:hypothetical protein